MRYIHCSTFHICCVYVTQCISRCSPMYILLGYLCWVKHCVTWCIYIGVHCPLYTLGIYIVMHVLYTLYCKESNMHCVALDIYIVLHRVYTLCCIEPNIHCVSCVIYIVLHRLYTLHCIVRCYTMYITVRKCIYGYNTMYVATQCT